MKIVKRLLILFITLTLCAGYANAEEYVTLAQLREQPKMRFVCLKSLLGRMLSKIV